MNYITGLLAWENVQAGLAGTYEYLQQGVLLGDIARDICTIKGFERFTKKVDSNFKFLALCPVIGQLFEPIRKQHSDFKTLLYGAMTFGSTADTFVKYNKETGKYELTLLPHYDKDTSWGAKKGDIDWVKLLGGLGNLVETVKLIQDYYYPFSFISSVSRRMGEQKVFEYSIKDLPFGYSLCERPRDIIVFICSLMSVDQWRNDTHRWSWENLFKISGSLAKIALIPCAAMMEKGKYVLTIRILDLVVSESSWLGGVVKSATERQKEIPR